MNKLPKKYDLVDKEFGHLRVIKQVEKPPHLENSKYTYWKCICLCGNELVASRYSLKDGKISCGCIKKPRKPYTKKKVKEPKYVDLNLKRLRATWHKMKRRCFDMTDNEYHNYGAKGISVCDRWLDFNNFKEDMYESYLEFEQINGEKSATIDRINSKGNYEPSNCRWATQLEQARNRSNNISVELDGITYGTISQLAEAYDIGYKVVYGRYSRGIRGFGLVDKSGLRNKNIVKDSNDRLIKVLSDDDFNDGLKDF